jgi:foldase protein PrsA
MDRVPGCIVTGFALFGMSIAMFAPAGAQTQSGSATYPTQPAVPGSRTAKPGAASKARPKVNLNQINVPPVQPAAIPVQPSDPIAVVNGQIISRQQLADECVARKGKEILDTLINRTIIEQALRANKMEVTAADIDKEIEDTAQRFGTTREKWLLTLEKERGVSPLQYARDIIYPALALRKLSARRVQVKEEDMKAAFEARFGEKIRCRMIMVEKGDRAIEVWEELKKNPGGFEKLAQDRSIDRGSAALGGQLAEPITRHAYPQTVSDRAFQQLVDGDPADKDPSHKPKDGDFTGPIQVGEMAWVILRRESVVPAVKNVSLSDPNIRKETYEMIYDVKLKEKMSEVFQEYAQAAGIENKLTGTVKSANEEQQADYKKAKSEVDGQVELMSNPAPTRADSATKPGDATVAPTTRSKLPTPAGLAPDAAAQFQNLQRPLKGSSATDGTSAPNN